MDLTQYAGREQTYVKHMILQKYLTRFAIILGQYHPSITYVDCFSGPWKSKDDDYRDSSFAIAIKQLRDAKQEVKKTFGREIRLRAIFLEKDKSRYAQLKEYASKISDVEIETHNDALENCVPKIAEFVQRVETFPFVFIDPTGWSGFSLDVIQPLLQLVPCEVLINFMTQHVVRFIDNESSRESFERLFGSADFKDSLSNTSSEDRVDQAVSKYCTNVSAVGNYRFTGVATVLNPLRDRAHFHLIYLSRDAKGLEVFKACEKSSMRDMEKAREIAKMQKRVERTGQHELFFDDEDVTSLYFQTLRERYLKNATSQLVSSLPEKTPVLYDEVWRQWLSVPLVWESDLKDAITRLGVRIEGLAARERTPKRKKNHRLILNSRILND